MSGIERSDKDWTKGSGDSEECPVSSKGQEGWAQEMRFSCYFLARWKRFDSFDSGCGQFTKKKKERKEKEVDEIKMVAS